MGRISNDEKMLAGFSHLMIVLVVFGWIGIAVALVIWSVKKDRSGFIKQSVKQAIAYQVTALIILQVLNLLGGHRVVLSLTHEAGNLGLQAVGLLWALAASGLLVCGVIGAVVAFRGKRFRYPVIGGFIDNILN